MKRKATVLISSVLLVQGLFAGAAFASTYDPSTDSTVNVSTGNTSSGIVNPLFKTTSSATFQTQEAVQNTLTSTTGLQVAHSYIWVAVNGVPVVGIDPPRAMY